MIALIRHGDYRQPKGVPSAWLPYALTELGRRQALEAANNIRRFCEEKDLRLWPRILSSPLLRAYETARILSETLYGEDDPDRAIEQSDALRERGLGSLANLTVDEISAVAAQDPRVGTIPDDWKTNSRYRLPYPGAESQIEAGKKVFDYLEGKRREIFSSIQRDTLVLAVGHGGSIRHACYYFGVFKLEEIPDLSMHHADPIYFQWGEGTLSHVEGKWKIRNKGEGIHD